MTKNILRSLAVFLTICLGCMSVFAQEETTDSVAVNQIVEGGVSVSSDINNIKEDDPVVPLGLQTNDYKRTKEWKRSKVLLGCGIGSLALGAAIFTFCSLVITPRNTDTEPGFGVYVGSILGGPFMLASIPLFIFAHKNKVKAKKSVANVGLGAITAPMGGNKREVVPALTFSLNF